MSPSGELGLSHGKFFSVKMTSNFKSDPDVPNKNLENLDSKKKKMKITVFTIQRQSLLLLVYILALYTDTHIHNFF